MILNSPGTRLMLRVLGFVHERHADAAARRAAAEALVNQLADEFERRRLALIDLEEFHIVPRGGWLFYSHARYAQTCTACGAKTEIGKPVYWRPDDPTVALCGPCGDREVSPSVTRHVAIDNAQLFTDPEKGTES